MSSDLFVYDNSFFSDSFSPFADSHPQSPLEILEEIQTNSSDLVQDQIPLSSINESACLDQIASALLSPLPPSVQLENLNLSQLGNAAYPVKTEDFPINFDSGFGVVPQSFDRANETAVRFMQRSFSSNSFEHKQNFSFLPQFDSIWESQNLQSRILDSMGTGHMRRVYSTGDLQKVKGDVQTRNGLSGEKFLMEEVASFKRRKYTAEGRKERIDRYRAKRAQRNFNKTIKYACRKTLADNRPRIRGRFARNDEAGEIPKASRSYEDEDDHHLWIDGFQEEDEEGSARRWTFFTGGSGGAWF